MFLLAGGHALAVRERKAEAGCKAVEALVEVIVGEEFGHELLTLEILQLSVAVGHALAQNGALQTVVATPCLAVWQEDGAIALAHALGDHGEGRTRAVYSAPLVKKVTSSLQSAEVDDGIQAVLLTEDGSVLFVQLGVSEPWVALGRLEKITNERKTGGPRRQASAEGIVAVRDDGERDHSTAHETE